MKSLMALWQVVANEMATWCHICIIRDFKTVTERVEHEGLSFLTITLSTFGSDFQKSLDRGFVAHDLFNAFAFAGGLPRFLGGFLELVFDRKTGRLLDDPSIDAIFAIRQLSMMFAKILIPCSDVRVRDSIDRYVECESEVRAADAARSSSDLDEFSYAFSLLFGDVLTRLDEDVYYNTLIPRHGPGKTADKLTGNRKFYQTEWTQRLEHIFPYGEYALPNWRYYYQLDSVDFREPGQERPVKVVTVPKTLKTPRIIAIEPTCMQYMQQALGVRLVEYLEGDDILSKLIGFRDQVPNREMARIGSIHKTLATLDLSDASDRVSNQLVRSALARWPHLAEAVDATRSRSADIPGHGVHRLAKYASMGSALCFPIEAMVFTTCILIGFARFHNRRPSHRLVRQMVGSVRVYGDDLIVPSETVACVSETLALYGAKVNSGKSFWTGKFRESCGGDFYDGVDVTPVRVRRVIPSSRKHAEEVVSLVSFRNQCYWRGMWHTAQYLDRMLNSILRYYPVVSTETSIVGRESVLWDTNYSRLHPHWHCPIVKGYVIQSKIPRSPFGDDGTGALLKCLLKQGDQPFADVRHLERAGRPEAVYLKPRWERP